MTDYLLPGRLTAESEFYHVTQSGACGVESIAALLRAIKQSDNYTVASCFNDIHGWGLCDSNGIMTTSEIVQACHKYGLSTQLPGPENPIGFATHFFAPTPRAGVIFYYENGQALVDEISHDGMDATNLHGHFNTAVGYNNGAVSARVGHTLPEGFWVADGDNNIQNPIVNGARVHRGLNTDLVYYSVSTLSLAHMVWCVAAWLPTPPTPQTQVFNIILKSPTSLNTIAKACSVNLTWLQNWNLFLKNDTATASAFNDTSLELPAGTNIHIPYR